uniref:Uncharacterized protein MANES_12G005400 n=1 Tax=Rhizophora mucronata TaxID=61149 RepID=A0A2P2J9H5_RHIMU
MREGAVAEWKLGTRKDRFPCVFTTRGSNLGYFKEHTRQTSGETASRQCCNLSSTCQMINLFLLSLSHRPKRKKKDNLNQ